MTVFAQNALSTRTVRCLVAPAPWTRLIVSVRNDAAPRAAPADPPRSPAHQDLPGVSTGRELWG